MDRRLNLRVSFEGEDVSQGAKRELDAERTRWASSNLRAAAP